MKIYFELNGYSVIDHEAKEFAKYKITNTSRCFNDIESAILYCIGCAHGKSSDSQLMAYVNTFMTMVKFSDVELGKLEKIVKQ